MKSPFITDGSSLTKIVLRHLSAAVRESFTFENIEDLQDEHISKVCDAVEKKLEGLKITSMDVEVGTLADTHVVAISLQYSATYYDITVEDVEHVFTFNN